MADPVGLISGTIGPAALVQARNSPAPRQVGGPSFKEALAQEIRKVDEMQRSAEQAVAAFAAGKRDDLANVMLATQKAEHAFQMLLQVRTSVLEAYHEVMQIRV